MFQYLSLYGLGWGMQRPEQVQIFPWNCVRAYHSLLMSSTGKSVLFDVYFPGTK
jgi:hypothetical protein